MRLRDGKTILIREPKNQHKAETKAGGNQASRHAKNLRQKSKMKKVLSV
jgi:hypothetical protein